MTPVKQGEVSIENWLVGIDSILLKYAPEFRKLDIVNRNCVKFMRPRDFDKFRISSVHRRMILHEVEKLQTPGPKPASRFWDQSPPGKSPEKHPG
jgi:hypothetical protein